MDFLAFFVIKKSGKYDKTGPLTRPPLSFRRKIIKLKVFSKIPFNSIISYPLYQKLTCTLHIAKFFA